MVYTNPLPAARSNGSSAKLESAASLALSTGSSQPFLTSSQRAALDAALAAKMSTLTTGEAVDPHTKRWLCRHSARAGRTMIVAASSACDATCSKPAASMGIADVAQQKSSLGAERHLGKAFSYLGTQTQEPLHCDENGDCDALAAGSDAAEVNGSPSGAAAGKPALASKGPKEAVKTKGELLHDRKSRAGKGSFRGSKKNGAGAI